MIRIDYSHYSPTPGVSKHMLFHNAAAELISWAAQGIRIRVCDREIWAGETFSQPYAVCLFSTHRRSFKQLLALARAIHLLQWWGIPGLWPDPSALQNLAKGRLIPPLPTEESNQVAIATYATSWLLGEELSAPTENVGEVLGNHIRAHYQRIESSHP